MLVKRAGENKNMLSLTFRFATVTSSVKTFSGNVNDCFLKATTVLDVKLVQQGNASICGWLTAANKDEQKPSNAN